MGGGTFKKSFKRLRASLCLWNHPITHFYQHWTCKTRLNSRKKKKKKKSEISLKLNFKISPAKGRPDCWVFGGWRDVKLQPRLPLKEGSKAEKEAAHFILAVFRHVAPPAFILNQCLDLAWIISWQWKTQIHCYVYVTVYHSCICL